MPKPTGRPAVFLDRDGTLVRDIRHSADPDRLSLLPGVATALQALHGAGYALVVVTNQSGVARGRFTSDDVKATRERLVELLPPGVDLAGHYHCPHHPDGSVGELAVACRCRKPAPGMILQAATELGLALSRSWLLGDSLTDVAAARAAGVRPILVDIGREALAPGARAPLIARNLPHAAQLVLAADGYLPRGGAEGGRKAAEERTSAEHGAMSAERRASAEREATPAERRASAEREATPAERKASAEHGATPADRRASADRGATPAEGRTSAEEASPAGSTASFEPVPAAALYRSPLPDDRGPDEASPFPDAEHGRRAEEDAARLRRWL